MSVENGRTGTDGRELFAYDVRKDGRAVVRLRGTAQSGGGVTVHAEVSPQGGSETLVRPFAFTSHEHAMRFLDEALTALEYIGCSIA